MDQLARDDITAAAAAHQELGRDYDGAVAEGLIERIGAEIDKRIDARLGQRGDAPGHDSPGHRDHAGQRDLLGLRDRGGLTAPAARSPWPGVVLAFGSMGLGIGAAAAVLGAGGNSPTVALIWIIIAIINVVYAVRRR